MTDAETIAALRAELEVQRRSHSDLFSRLCQMERELQRLNAMRSVLWQLCELTGEVYDAKKVRERQ